MCSTSNNVYSVEHIDDLLGCVSFLVYHNFINFTEPNDESPDKIVINRSTSIKGRAQDRNSLRYVKGHDDDKMLFMLKCSIRQYSVNAHTCRYWYYLDVFPTASDPKLIKNWVCIGSYNMGILHRYHKAPGPMSKEYNWNEKRIVRFTVLHKTIRNPPCFGEVICVYGHQDLEAILR